MRLVRWFWVCLALIMVAPSAHAADFGKGLAAYWSGNYETALQELRPLAEEGAASVQFYLGVMYENGKGVLQDYEQAVHWYRLAAEQGIAEAQAILGIMYRNGEGVLADHKRAHMWLNIARYNGLKKAGDAIELVEPNMTGSDISRAQDMAKRCVASDYKDC